MNFQRKLFFFVFILNLNLIFSQEKTGFPFLKFSAVSVSTGPALISSEASDSAAFQSLVTKDNVALHPDLSLYSQQKRPGLGSGSETVFGFSFRMRKQDRTGYRERSVLQIGIVFSQQSFISTSYRYATNVRFDTLNGSSSVTFLDSVYNYRRDFSYNIKQVGLSASWIFNSDPAKNFGLFGGISVGQYASYSNKVDINFTERIQIKQVNSSGQSSNYNGFGKQPKPTSTLTSLDAKNSFTARIGIPVGATIRLAKTKPVLQNIQLFFESRPGLGLTVVNGYKTYVRAWWTAQFGVRVLFF